MRNNSIQKPEILSPAGSPESLEAAVRAGADAVYLGAAAFSARANAKNFDDAALRDAVRYCHTRGVKVHLAVNTLLLDGELPHALKLIQYACTLPVDAVILQDLGLLRLLRKYAPELPLHASTQMSAHTPAAVRLLERAGFSRVVLAREMSLAEIKEARQGTSVELEAFVHGALCMSVSGQCYFSSVLGGRSGNRGQCAQPCRLPFSVPGGTGHDLSLKDLSMASRLTELAEAGVVSAKIEGRMKRPEYVAAATRACRLAADGEPIPTELMENLESVFSRSGFTTGYPDGKRGREMFGTRTKEDAAASGAVLTQLHALYQREAPRVPVRFTFTARLGASCRLLAEDGEGFRAEVAGETPEPARTRPLTSERCEEQLSKTGNTPFFVREAQCNLEGEISLPASALNALRRDALEALEKARASRTPIPFEAAVAGGFVPHEGIPFSASSLRVRFSGAKQVPENAASCGTVILPYNAPAEVFSRWKQGGTKVLAELPRGLFGMEDAARKQLAALREHGVTEVWAGNLGAAGLALEQGFAVHGGFSLNIANTEALEWARELGLNSAELSFELALQQAAKLGGILPRGLLLYGRLPMMLCRNCPAANGSNGCMNCKEPPMLTDRKGISFPVQCAGACSEVLNSVPLWMADRLREAGGVDFGVLRFTTETKEEAGRVIGAYLEAMQGKTTTPPETGFTRGLYYKGVV